MKNVEEDINKAIAIINGEYNYADIFEKYCRIYPFTNENLIRCFNKFDLRRKKCLTVLGSSDQAFDMYLRGAREITTFDINILTKYFFYLKKAAILSNLTKEEYINFFYPHSIINDINNYKVFSRISKNLSGDNLIFWTKLFEEFKPSIISSNLFTSDTHYKRELKDNISYLEDSKFYFLREKLKDTKTEFINTDVKDLPHKLLKMYDFIYLSNIMCYSKEIFNNKNMQEAIEEYKKLIFDLSKHLNSNGNIIICYFFYTLKYYSLVKEIFPEENFSFEDIREHTSGAFLQYTKK